MAADTNGRMDVVAKLVLGLIGALLTGTLYWFGTTVNETARDMTALRASTTARLAEVGRDVDEVKKIVDENRKTLGARTGTLENHELRIEYLERQSAR